MTGFGLAKDLGSHVFDARYSPLSDIFACGVILYRLLTGLEAISL